MTLEELTTIVQKHMFMADTKIIKLLSAFVVAARMPISAPWLVIVSAASNGKALLPDHEVLTDKGWKFICDIKIGDRVLAWDLETNTQLNGNLKYAEVKGVSENDHDGLIYTSNQHCYFKASPDHRWFMSHENKHRRIWRVVRSPDLNKNTDIPATGNPIELTQNNFSAEEMELIGWYIAEGCAHWNLKHRSIIAQSKQSGKDRIRFLLQKLKIPFNEQLKSFDVKWKPPFECGNNCYTKFIPRPLMEEKNLPALLSGLIQGDGSYVRMGWEYYSASKQLIDDVQEIAIKLGWRTRVSPKKVNYKYRSTNDTSIKIKNGKGMFPGHLVKNYRLGAYKRPVWCLPKLKTEHYKGKTYCLWVPGPGSFIARYKGTAFVTGNSTLLSGLEGCKGLFKVDNLTPKTFFSGVKTKPGEPSTSLIDRLLPNSILTIKDMSTIISKNDQDLGEIMAQLRLIYDGNFDAVYGNGKHVTWQGKLSLLAGGTASVYDYLPKMSSMGDRFLLYHFDSPDRIQMTEKALEEPDEKLAASEIKKAFTDFIENIKIPKEVRNASPELRTKIAHIAELATRARTAVNRNKYKKDAFESGAYTESPPRFAKQLLALALGLMVVNGDWKFTAEDEVLLFKVALDSIPRYRREAMQQLTKFSVAETRAVARKMNMETSAVSLILYDLEYVGMIKRTEASANRNHWELLPQYRQMLAQYEKIEMVDDILIDDNDEPEPEAPPAVEMNIPEWMVQTEPQA